MISVDPEKYPFISHAYAMTVHKSQGQSIDRVHVFADSSKGGLSTNAGYVQMSRAKEELTVYTDSRADLEKQYKREQIAENAGERVDTAKFAEAPQNRLIWIIQQVLKLRRCRRLKNQ
jgi:ATP-dependent exoDNAse (exonuclease V) alpha subunit